MSVIGQSTPPAPKRGLRKLATRGALRTLRHRPAWFFRNLLQGPEMALDARRRTGAEAFRAVAQPESRAVAGALGVAEEEYDAAVQALWTPASLQPDDPLGMWQAWGARDELLRIVGATVALVRPRAMVETGVALGFTTATVLQAMEANGVGMLHSIDLPPLEYDPAMSVGAAVPGDVRHRWDLRLGDSRKLLAPLAAEVAPIDAFLHDSIHTYASQLREYRTVWPHLRQGAVLISDDVENPAFIEFATEVGAEPFIVLSANRRQHDETSAVGLLRKD